MIQQNTTHDHYTYNPVSATWDTKKEIFQEPKQRQKRFSVIGSGFIFPTHLEAIQSVGQITGYDTDEDYVSILTPNNTHLEYCLKETEKGKIVLCEKPLVIKSSQIKYLKDNIFVVHQLRYHHLVKEIKDRSGEIEIDVSVYRDEKYYRSWKGQKQRSGGLLFNLGIHYFDLLLYLFGEAKNTKTISLTDKTGIGIIEGDNYRCKWKISTEATKENQKRLFKINGVDYNFSSKDNLAYENLHKFVYQDMLLGKGVRPEEALKSIRLVEQLYD